MGAPYVFYYTGMFIYDLFIKKDPAEFMPKPKDVEIDISDEAGQFKPISVEKSEPKQQTAAALNSSVPKSDEEIVPINWHKGYNRNDLFINVLGDIITSNGNCIGNLEDYNIAIAEKLD